MLVRSMDVYMFLKKLQLNYDLLLPRHVTVFIWGKLKNTQELEGLILFITDLRTDIRKWTPRLVMLLSTSTTMVEPGEIICTSLLLPWRLAHMDHN